MASQPWGPARPPCHATAPPLALGKITRGDILTGNLTMDGLAEAVAAGTIDTVLVVLVDMQGRLMGKRFQAEFFLASGHRETHGCNYLLATDLGWRPSPAIARPAGPPAMATTR